MDGLPYTLLPRMEEWKYYKYVHCYLFLFILFYVLKQSCYRYNATASYYVKSKSIFYINTSTDPFIYNFRKYNKDFI